MKKLLLAAIVGGLVVLAGNKVLQDKPTTAQQAPAPQTQSAFDKVLASQTVRCAYAAYDPMLIIGTDKKLTGIFHDVLEEAAKRLSLKVDWAEEVGYGNINTG